ncbi:MAG: anhydro-N-acetylmuramic acid kinase [Bacteroidota bacterium]
MPEEYVVTGLMSGTSLDGVDLACAEFTRSSGAWQFRIIEAETTPYPASLKEQLEEAVSWKMEKIGDLNLSLGRHYAELINDFHNRNNLAPDLVASHGHTILHEPDKGITLQAGDGATMARLTGTTVITDFRSEDVAQGGQGAPLVPVGDRLLFGGYGACLNLGGFANISYEGKQNQRIAFDVGPCNLALNWIAGLRGVDFDRDGAIAGTGTIGQNLLARLNALEYYLKDPPKSLGKEWLTDLFLPLLEQSQMNVPDLMATVVEHIAIQLTAVLKEADIRSLLVTGGGALNQTLLKRLREYSGTGIEIPHTDLINYKEALVFGLLGLLKYLGEVNCLASVTGGVSDLSAGIVHRI